MLNKNQKLISIAIIILVVLILSQLNLIYLVITGRIIATQEMVRVGLLSSEEIPHSAGLRITYSFENFLDKSRFELMVRDNKDLNSSMNDFINSDVKIIFVVDSEDLFKIYEMANKNKIILFSISAKLSLYDLGEHTFFLRDSFFTPTLILADAANSIGIKRVGIVYMKSSEAENDDSSDVFNLTFTRMSGNILFKSNFYVENKSNTTEILNLIRFTNPEALAFLGYGTKYKEFIDLVTEINNYNNTIKIFSLGYGTMHWSDEVPNALNDVIFVEHEYDPETAIAIPFAAYPYYIETHIFIEILEDIVNLCGNNTGCMQERLHENVFSTVVGDVKFRKKGSIIRPYLLYEATQTGMTYYEMIQGTGSSIKKYTLSDIEEIINNYNLDFLE